MATKLRAVSCNVVRKNNPTCACKKNPVGETVKRAAKRAAAKAGAATKRAAVRVGRGAKSVAKRAAVKVGAASKRVAKRVAKKTAGVARGAAAGMAKGWRENPAKAPKIKAISFQRYNGGVRVKRQWGSSTVTSFYVGLESEFGKPGFLPDVVEGFGKTPGERKTFAVNKWKRDHGMVSANPCGTRRRNPAKSAAKKCIVAASARGKKCACAKKNPVVSVVKFRPARRPTRQNPAQKYHEDYDKYQEWGGNDENELEEVVETKNKKNAPFFKALKAKRDKEYKAWTSRRNPASKTAPKMTAVPKGQIEYIVRNYHVGTPDSEVRANIEDRARRAGASDKIVKACGDYAVKCHRANQKMYGDVMSGNIGSGRKKHYERITSAAIKEQKTHKKWLEARGMKEEYAKWLADGGGYALSEAEKKWDDGSGKRRRNPAKAPSSKHLEIPYGQNTPTKEQQKIIDAIRSMPPGAMPPSDSNFMKRNPAKAATGRTGVASITVTRLEGGNHDLNVPHKITTDPWKNANDLLATWCAEAGSAKNKCKFVVKYMDGESYSGTFYVSKALKRPDLRKHIQKTIEAAVGKRRPAHMTPEQYKQHLAKVPAGAKRKWMTFLRKYA